MNRYTDEVATAKPLDVLRALIVGEAEGESYQGKLAVAWVARNRAARPGWWGVDLKSACLAKHQFSCFWSDWPKRAAVILKALRNPAAYSEAHKAALAAVEGTPPDPTKGATHYFNPSIVKPDWAASLVPTVRIGAHDFYRG